MTRSHRAPSTPSLPIAGRTLSRRAPRFCGAAGFTLIEMLVATAIMLTLTAAVFTALNPSQGIFQSQSELSDMQQRLRVGVDTLTHDLMAAGAGAYLGSQPGGLVGFFAPILPARRANLASIDDGPGAYRTNAITLLYVPSTPAQTSTFSAMTNASSDLTVNPEPRCPATAPLCGFTTGMGAVVYDTAGAFDIFTVTGVVDASLQLQHAQQPNLSRAYPAGATIAQIARRVYYFDAAANQLMRSDGFQTTMPVLDNVVALQFEYYGEPTPPALRRPGVDQSATYGPSPPALGVAGNPWPAGENCTIQVVGGQQVPRLAVLGNPGGGLVRLTAAQVTDGDASGSSAWCPDANSPNRFDADLLRIRKIRVTIRLQTPNAGLRGSLAAGPDALFATAGTSSPGYRYVPDQAIRFDVSPRNMNLGR